MSGGTRRQQPSLSVPHASASLAGAPADDSVLGELMRDKVAETAPVPAPAAAADPVEAPAAVEEAPAAPPVRRARKPRTAARVTGVRRPQMPARLAEKGRYVPLQASLPATDHYEFKVNTTALGSSMTRVVTALVGIYNTDPELFEALMERAEQDRSTVGDMLHDVLVDFAAD